MFIKIMQRMIDFNRVRTLKETSTANFQSGTGIQSDVLFELIMESRELSAIPEVFQLLFSKDVGTRLKSAKILNSIMCTLNSSQLIKVDKIFRSRGSYTWDYNWNKKKPKELLHPLMTVEEKMTILGLSSFHTNGYFREKAIRKLSQMNTGFEIPYLLIRINDWVGEVRNVSKENLLRYLEPENAVSFVNSLPLVFRLEDCLRGEHNDILNAVVSMLSSPECSSKLINGLHSTDSKVNLYGSYPSICLTSIKNMTLHLYIVMRYIKMK